MKLGIHQQLTNYFDAYVKRQTDIQAFELQLLELMNSTSTSVPDCLQVLSVYAEAKKLGGARYERIRKRILSAGQAAGIGDDLTVPLNNVGEILPGEQQRGKTQHRIGTVLQDRYLIESIIGRGGLSIIYKAQDLRRVEAGDPNSWVVIKMLSPEFRDRDECRAILQKEAMIGQRCRHHNLVAIYDIDRDGQDLFLVEEYIEGSTMAGVFGAEQFTGLYPEVANPLIKGVCEGLSFMHNRGFVHADIKPGNLFIDGDNAVRIIDFGNARFTEVDEIEQLEESRGADTGITPAETPRDDAEKTTEKLINSEAVVDADNTESDGKVAGLTPAYAALGPLTGELPTDADDIYALGCVVAEVLSGKHPFDRQNAQLAFGKKAKPNLPQKLWPWQQYALRRALSHERSERPTADSFWDWYSGAAFRRLIKRVGVFGLASIVLLGAVWYGVIAPYHTKQHVSTDLSRASIFSKAEAVGAIETLPSYWQSTIVRQHNQSLRDYFVMRMRELTNTSVGAMAGLPSETNALIAQAKRLDLSSSAIDQLQRLQGLVHQDVASRLSKRIETYLSSGTLHNQVDDVSRLITQLERIDSDMADRYAIQLQTKLEQQLQQAMRNNDRRFVAQQVENIAPIYYESTVVQQALRMLQGSRYELDSAGLMPREERSTITDENEKSQQISQVMDDSPSDAVNVGAAMAENTSGSLAISSTIADSPVDTQSDPTMSKASNLNVKDSVDNVVQLEFESNERESVVVAKTPVLAEEMQDLSVNLSADEIAALPLAQTVSSAFESEVVEEANSDRAKQIIRLLKQNSLTQARQTLLRAVRAGDQETIRQVRGTIIAAYINFTKQQVENKFFTKALGVLSKIHKIYPDDAELNAKIDEYTISRSEYLVQGAVRGQYSLTSASVNQGIDYLRSNHPQRYQNLAETLLPTIVVEIERLSSIRRGNPLLYARRVGNLFPEQAQLYRSIAESSPPMVR